MARWSTAGGIVCLLVALLASAMAADRSASPADPSAVLGGDSEGFLRALEPRAFRFPADHAAHPGYRVEWWYFTGNLVDASDRPFGFQLTFFRFALAPGPAAADSAWADKNVWMAHFAVSDIAGGRFHALERFARQGPGLAGARAPFEVWLEDWSAVASGAQAFPLRLRAAGQGLTLDLELEQGKPIVLQGEGGLSRKSAAPGNASYYYSLTRMPARGRVTLGGEVHEVTGDAWLDREWSTSALGADQVGWDWFALQLADGRELMFYRLRQAGGVSDPASAGVLVAADGSTVRLAAGDVQLETLDGWRSPDGVAEYPARQRLRVPRHAIDLEIRPRLADQEWRGRFRYWEGAVSVHEAGEPHTALGHGYLEMTGYAPTASQAVRQAVPRR